MGKIIPDEQSDDVCLYRAVSAEEFYSIMKIHRFTFHPKGVDVKYFGVDFEETLAFANEIINIDLVAVIEVSVARAVLNRVGDFIHVDPFLFKSGTVEIHAEQLDEFNNAIKYIAQRY